MALSEAQAARLLDFTLPFDLPTLDNLVALMYQATNPAVRATPHNVPSRAHFRPQAQKAASNILTQFKQHDQAWTRCHQILQEASNAETKVCASHARISMPSLCAVLCPVHPRGPHQDTMEGAAHGADHRHQELYCTASH